MISSLVPQRPSWLIDDDDDNVFTKNEKRSLFSANCLHAASLCLDEVSFRGLLTGLTPYT